MHFCDVEAGVCTFIIDLSFRFFGVQRKCIECGQYLPERYEPPADEDWTTGILGCLEDTDSCEYAFILAPIVIIFLFFLIIYYEVRNHFMCCRFHRIILSMCVVWKEC